MRMLAAVVMALGVALGGPVGDGAGASEFPGTGALAGKAKLKVRPCGKTTEEVALDILVSPDGAWTLSDGIDGFAGAGAILGKAGRKLGLELDAPSMTALVALLEGDASELCGGPVAATDAVVRKAVLKVNAKGTRARLVLLLVATGVADDGSAGKAKYRVVAKGTWVGPLSCEEVFECTRVCAIDDVGCQDACLARGSLETQATVESLTACVDARCPARDPVCVAGVLAGDCRDEYEACVPPPPPTNLTCEEIFECAEDCGGQRCIDDCFERGSGTGRSEATAVSRCVNRVCPNGGGACQASALAGACAYVWEDCTGTPPPRNLSCAGILDCMTTCPSGSTACLADCRDRGSATGVSQLVALDACIDAACPTRLPACVAQTVTGQCKTQWETCFG